MASSHVHSIKRDDGTYYHLYNILFMNTSELEVLALSLSGKPIPTDKIEILNNLKSHMIKMHESSVSVENKVIEDEDINEVKKDK